MTISLSIKKDKKKNFLHIDLTCYQGNKMCIHTLPYALYNQAVASTERLEQICTLSMRAHICFTNFYCHGAHN